MNKTDEELRKTYGASERGNFYVKGTIGVPHPYCITSRHVVHASDHFNGMLGKDAIESAEKAGITCHTCRGQLTFEEHETALVIACKKELKGPDGAVDPELVAYVNASVTMCEKDGYAGFAFVKAEKE